MTPQETAQMKAVADWLATEEGHRWQDRNFTPSRSPGVQLTYGGNAFFSIKETLPPQEEAA